jgi:hypothetical protein
VIYRPGIGLDAAGVKHLGYDPLWPRRGETAACSARQNGPAIPMPEAGRPKREARGRPGAGYRRAWGSAGHFARPGGACDTYRTAL